MFEPKPISVEAIPAALKKAERYRLLNEPREAESICRDVLRADADSQEALIMLLLSLTDQFNRAMRVSINHAQELLPRILDDYRRTYYAGVILERWAKAQAEQGVPGYVLFGWFEQAMTAYEAAEALARPGHEDARLRWNTCARILRRNEQIRPKDEERAHHAFTDEAP